MLLFLIFTLPARAVIQTGTIQFGSNGVKINNTNVSFTNDGLGKEWTILSAGTTTPAFVQEEDYSQIGNSNNSKLASGISIQINIGQTKTITNAAITMCGYADNIYLKAGNQLIGSGSASSYTVSTICSTDNSMQDSKVNIQITGINGPIKIYSITYSYDDGFPNVYERPVAANCYGTICMPYSITSAEGITFYNVVGKQEVNNLFSGLILEEATLPLDAGRPYIFKTQAETTQMNANLAGNKTTQVRETQGLVGKISLDDEKLPGGEYIYALGANDNLLHNIPQEMANLVAFAQYKAYVNIENLSVPEPASSAEGRVMLSVVEENVATHVIQLEDDYTNKIIKNGKLYILRNGVTYDILGNIVK